MNRSHFAPLFVCVGYVALLLSASLSSVAASFSGQVVDEAGIPVSDVTVAILPKLSETDETGAFSITDIASPSVSTLMLLPAGMAEHEIRTVAIEGVPFYPNPLWHRGRFSIAIEPGADVKDVEITVRLRMRIRGRVLLADGTPLRDAEIQLEINQRNTNERRGSSKSRSRNLDADGYFFEYVEDPAYYTITVAYQEQFAESEEILLEDGQRLDGLALTLSDDPDAQLPSTAVVKPVLKTTVLAAVKPAVKPQIVTPPRAYDPQSWAEAARQREREGVWAINPDNRHAYKRIYCKTREEAVAKAIAQGAYLVAINDAAEQHWLFEVFGKENLSDNETEQTWNFRAFGRESHWIGLTNGKKVRTPHWDNGEPVTYTNWDSAQRVIEGDPGDVNQNYAVFVGRIGKWQSVPQGSSIAGLVGKAILEKEHFIPGTSEPSRNNQRKQKE